MQVDEPAPDENASWAEILTAIDGSQAAGADEKWSHSLHSNGVRSVFERDGVVYSGASDDTVVAADASDGSEIWSHELHSAAVRSVFERDGVVYSGAQDDTVKAAQLVDENGDPLEEEPGSWQLQVSDGQEWYEV